MTVVVDINVLLDVFQQRAPFYAASAAVVNQILFRKIQGVCPAHGLTTLFYLARKHAGQAGAENAIDQVLSFFEIGSLDKSDWRRARTLAMPDFEDAVVSVTAEAWNASFIITRNEPDFRMSSVPAISPAAFLSRFPAA